MSVKISTSFYDKLDDKKVGTAMGIATTELSYELYKKCVKKSPYKTGKLQESHSVQNENSPSELKAKAKIKNGAKYWSYVEFGTSKMSARRWVFQSLQETDAFATFSKSFKAHYKTSK